MTEQKKKKIVTAVKARMAACAAIDAASCECVVAPEKPVMDVPGEVPTSPLTVTTPVDVAEVLASTAKDAAAPRDGEIAAAEIEAKEKSRTSNISNWEKSCVTTCARSRATTPYLVSQEMAKLKSGIFGFNMVPVEVSRSASPEMGRPPATRCCAASVRAA
jgi:hypothetical protein